VDWSGSPSEYIVAMPMAIRANAAKSIISLTSISLPFRNSYIEGKITKKFKTGSEKPGTQ